MSAFSETRWLVFAESRNAATVAARAISATAIATIISTSVNPDCFFIARSSCVLINALCHCLL